MRAVDTNVIVRFLTGDDPRQAARALIGHTPIFVPRTVLLETEWVLRSIYGMQPARTIPALRALAGLPGVTIEDSGLAAREMDTAEAGLDFADAQHLAAASGRDDFLTFDRRLVRARATSGGINVCTLDSVAAGLSHFKLVLRVGQRSSSSFPERVHRRARTRAGRPTPSVLLSQRQPYSEQQGRTARHLSESIQTHKCASLIRSTWHLGLSPIRPALWLRGLP
jgi:predicted nucleic acid-binding protein